MIVPMIVEGCRRRLPYRGLALVLISLVMLGGCGSVQDVIKIGEEKADVFLPAEQLVMKGMDEYNEGKYYLALEYFNEILDRYPFSPQAPLAELKAADSSYQMERYAEALVLYEEFEERHPTNEAIPYVMYQKGMCSYRGIDRIDRDTSGAVAAIQAFEELLRAYPDSPYTEEAQARIRAASEFLVNHEFFVVQYYLRAKKYNQAKVRLNYILAVYPDAKIAPQAQELLTLIEEGNPPRSGFASWFIDLSLPDWMPFVENKDENMEQPGEEASG
jgi:outer membrane protein assembly factor BamD